MQAPGPASLLQSIGRTTTEAFERAPLPALRPLCTRVAATLARRHPGLFARMGDHANKRFLIDPSDLPYVFLMVPNVGTPVLTIALRSDHPPHDGAIAGRFFDLLDLIGGALDGDALFFNRILRVTGDVEAVVALRNALDDFDGDLVDEILSAFGPLAPVGSAVLELARRMTGGSRT